MTIDDFIDRTRETARRDPPSTGSRFLVYTTGTKEFFAGELIDTSSRDAIVLRQPDGAEVLIFRQHIVAIAAAAD